MGKREAGIQSRIVDAAINKYGKDIFIRVTHGDAYATVGDPDIYGCMYGVFFGMEVKNEDGSLTKIQQYRLLQIRRAGGIAVGVRSVEEAMSLLHEIHVTKHGR